MYIAPPY